MFYSFFHKQYFIHRAGRTGRAGSHGVCITLYNDSDHNTINQLKNRGIRFVEGQYRNGTFKPVRQKGNGLSKTDAMRIEISKTLPKNKDKVKPGYKRKRMAMVDKIMRSKKRAYIQSKIKQQRVERYKSAQRQKREEAQ